MRLLLKNVTKYIKKDLILDHINVAFESGKIYGIIGRNGSGKTMLFRAMSGLMKTEGEIELDGKRLGKDLTVLPELGLVIENTNMYPEFSGYMNLKLLADINRKIGRKEIEEAMQRIGLDFKERKIVAKYSLGMKQKLAIAQAIMEKPKIMFFDEPTNGLDDVTVEKFRDILREERSKGNLIILASHSKEDIEELADQVFIMNSGRLREVV